MAFPFVAYASSRVTFHWNTVPNGGNWYDGSGFGAKIAQMADALIGQGWTREDTLHASGHVDFSSGFPTWDGDPEQRFIVFGDVLQRPGGRTIHFVTPYQLEHNPPVYEGVYIILASLTSADSGRDCVAACNALWPEFLWTLDPDGLGITFTAVQPGPQWNDWYIYGNGAWTGGGGIAKGGGLTMTSAASCGADASRVVLTFKELANIPHILVSSELWSEGAIYYFAWRDAFTVTANPYQLAIYCRTREEDVSFVGDGHQGNIFFFASAPYIEESLREVVTDCVFTIADWFTGRSAFWYSGGLRAGAARVNGVTCPAFDTGRDQGITFPVMHFRSTMGPLLTGGMKALILHAYVAISKNLGEENPGETRIVGRLWDAFQISLFHDWGQDVMADGHLWTPIIAQRAGGNEYETEASLFLVVK